MTRREWMREILRGLGKWAECGDCQVMGEDVGGGAAEPQVFDQGRKVGDQTIPKKRT